MHRLFRAAVGVLLVTGCAGPDPAARVDPLLEDGPRLVAIGEPTQPPEGSDGVPSYRVAFEASDGTLRPLDRDASAHVERWRAGAALIDPERRLYEVTPDGMRRMLVAGAVGQIALSPDHQQIAYAVVRDVLGDLRVHDGRTERTLATSMASVGVLRFADDGEGVAFVGARPGGVVGVWWAREGREPECLSNCELRTGEPWEDRFVPPPTSPDAFELREGSVAWTDADGARHEARLGGRP